jgi:hypothetical protein
MGRGGGIRSINEDGFLDMEGVSVFGRLFEMRYLEILEVLHCLGKWYGNSGVYFLVFFGGFLGFWKQL